MHIIIVPLLLIIPEAYYVSCCFVVTRADYKILLIALTLLYFIFPCLFMYHLVRKMATFKKYETLGGVIGTLYGRKAHIFTTVSSVIAMLLMLIVLLASVGITAVAIGGHLLLTILGIGVLGTLYARYSSMRRIKAAILLSFVMFIGTSGWWTKQVLTKYQGIQNIFSKMINVNKEGMGYWGMLSPYKMIFFIVLQLCLSLLAFASPTVIPTMLAMYKNKQKTANKINNIAIFYPLIRLLILISLFGFFLAEIPFASNFLPNLVKRVNEYADKDSGDSMALVLLFSCLLMVTIAVFIALIQALERMINLDTQHVTGKIRPVNYKIPYMAFLLGSVAIIGAWLLSLVPNMMGAVLCLAFTIATSCTLPFFFGVLTLKGHKKAFFASVGSLFGSIVVAVLLRPYLITPTIWDYLGYSFSLAIVVSSFCLFMVYYLFPKDRISPDIVDVPTAYEMIGARSQSYTHSWFSLRRWATSQMKIYPYEPRVLGFLLVMVHIFAALKFVNKDNLPACLTLVNTIGLILANILVWHVHFPLKIRRLFPYYWLFILFYCLPFNSMLSFLFQPDNISVLLQVLFGIFLLGCLVDRVTFFVLTSLGIGCALVLYYLQSEQPYARFTFSLTWQVVLGLTYSCVLSLLFNNRKNYSRQKASLVKNKIVATVFSRFLQNQLSMMPAKELANTLRQKVITSPKSEEEQVSLKLKDYKNLIIYSSDIIHLMNICKTQLGILEELLYYDRISEDHIVRRNIANVMQGAHHRLLLIYKNRVKLLDESTNFSIYVFPALFHHAIANIVENAFWYGDAREMVIWWSANERTLYIKDNGREIPGHLHASLFEPIDESDQRIASLRFVKMVVDLLGATISFTSKNTGTCFAIQFPPVD
ncbi:MAG: ATP-binding protein [Bacteroidota bacterium]